MFTRILKIIVDFFRKLFVFRKDDAAASPPPVVRRVRAVYIKRGVLADRAPATRMRNKYALRLQQRRRLVYV